MDADSFDQYHRTKSGYIILGGHYPRKYLYTPIGSFHISGCVEQYSGCKEEDFLYYGFHYSFKDIEKLPGIKIRKIHPYLLNDKRVFYEKLLQKKPAFYPVLLESSDGEFPATFGLFGPWYIVDEFDGKVLADDSLVPTYNEQDDVNEILEQRQKHPQTKFLSSLFAREELSKKWVQKVLDKARESLITSP